MGKSLLVDWNLAQALWLQGVQHKVISDRIGCPIETLRKHALRHGWTRTRQEATQVIGEEIAKIPVRNLSTVAQNIREKCALDAEDTIDALRERDPRLLKMSELAQREAVMKSAQGRGFAACGLDGQPVSHAINIDLMSALNAQFDKLKQANPSFQITIPQSVSDDSEGELI